MNIKEWLSQIDKMVKLAAFVFFAGLLSVIFGISLLDSQVYYAILFNILGAIGLITGIIGLIVCWINWAENG